MMDREKLITEILRKASRGDLVDKFEKRIGKVLVTAKKAKIEKKADDDYFEDDNDNYQEMIDSSQLIVYYEFPSLYRLGKFDLKKLRDDEYVIIGSGKPEWIIHDEIDAEIISTEELVKRLFNTGMNTGKDFPFNFDDNADFLPYGKIFKKNPQKLKQVLETIHTEFDDYEDFLKALVVKMK